MKSSEIRQAFLDFFKAKQHQIVPSAPMVLKDDPTLMFTNAGMNQFKDVFLGNSPIVHQRIADSQKCLRVSGKHNDLEEVGHDTYHHTMFEMLGNWSFGDYFKKEAIDWAWELLVEVLKVPSDRLYATVFEGSKDDKQELDKEAKDLWLKYLPEDRVLNGSKKDNFWEMGEQGPCGPCSEIHIDLRSEEERAAIPGAELVNKDHHLVIEIWNLVFIQFNRKASGELEQLPLQHVDTGMGFERLCMVLQDKKSNYDTDVFQPIITELGRMSGKKYGDNLQADIAMRVIADHLRTIAFSIADGQLPSNNKAGYVIRRILRRAVRYGYTFLGMNEAFMYKLLPAFIGVMGESYPELVAQNDIIEKVLKQEEDSFLRTLETGIKRLDKIINSCKKENKDIISGKDAFTLYDSNGFPFDLTDLIARENGLKVDQQGFDAEMKQQKDRARNASAVDTGDWIVINKAEEVEFCGYDATECNTQIIRYRKVVQNKKEQFQIVLSKTPFYAESGGQVGDTGFIQAGEEKISITDTKKENNLIVHFATKLPADLNAPMTAVVSSTKRTLTANNHTATHLLHAALQNVLGEHIEQKGSLVNADYLRFDFSHFDKMTDEQIQSVEEMVNAKIRENIALNEQRDLTMDAAIAIGAKALFGEKYGDKVRAITFDPNYSVELCGGIHAQATGQIGVFKITAEGAIAAGIRRIEAITAVKAEKHIQEELKTLSDLKLLLKNPKKPIDVVNKLMDENASLKKQIEGFEKEKLVVLKEELSKTCTSINGINVIAAKVDLSSPAMFKDLSFMLKDKIDNLFCVLGAEINGKANLSIIISESLTKDKNLNAGKMIREVSKEIQGGGGGQVFYATAGGQKIEGIQNAIDKTVGIIKGL